MFISLWMVFYPVKVEKRIVKMVLKTTSTSQFNPPTYKWLVSFLIVQPNYLTLFPSYSSNDVFNASAVGFCNNFFFRLLSKNLFPFLCLHIHQRSIMFRTTGIQTFFSFPFLERVPMEKGVTQYNSPVVYTCAIKMDKRTIGTLNQNERVETKEARVFRRNSIAWLYTLLFRHKSKRELLLC